jgi:hypothetical protein
LFAAVAALLVVTLSPWPAAGSAADDTWQGGSGGPPGPWSLGANWVGGIAPSSDAGQLTFPSLDPASCTAQSCSETDNDLVGNSTEGLAFDDSYELSGHALRLGAGGISSSAHRGVGITLPLVLTAPQTWTLAPNRHSNLDVERLSSAASLSEPPSLKIVAPTSTAVIFNGATEVGPLTITGGGRAILDVVPGVKPTVNVQDGAPMRLTGGSELSVAAIGATGPRTGPLRAVGGRVLVGTTTLHTASVSLDGASSLRLNIHGRKGVPGKSFGQLQAVNRHGRHSNVHLGGATLILTGRGRHNACARMRVGETYRLLTATGSVKGHFHGLPNGAVIPATCPSGRPGTPLKARIHYQRHAVTATAVTSGSHP